MGVSHDFFVRESVAQSSFFMSTIQPCSFAVIDIQLDCVPLGTEDFLNKKYKNKGEIIMTMFNEYVNASQIWAGERDFADEGAIAGLVRGYCVEVEKDGKTYWTSCEYIYGEPKDYFNDNFHQFQCQWNKFRYTGRISFRGYGILVYDAEEKETFVVDVDSKGHRI